MTESTRGPLKIEFNHNGGYDGMTDAFYILDDQENTLCEVDLRHYGQNVNCPCLRETFDQAKANAQLFAAAPNLKKACEYALAALKGELHPMNIDPRIVLEAALNSTIPIPIE